MAKILHNSTLFRGRCGSGEKKRGNPESVPNTLVGIVATAEDMVVRRDRANAILYHKIS